MQVAAFAEEVHAHAKRINQYENGKLTMAQQQNINAVLEQIHTMHIAMNSMKMAITQTFQSPPHAPLLVIGNVPMDDSADTPAPVTGSRSRQIEDLTNPLQHQPIDSTTTNSIDFANSFGNTFEITH